MSGSGLLKHKTGGEGLPWWSSGWDSELPLQGAQVRSLIRGLESYIWCGTTKKIQPSPPQKEQRWGEGYVMREVGARTQRVFKEQTGILRREGWDRGSAAV